MIAKPAWVLLLMIAAACGRGEPTTTAAPSSPEAGPPAVARFTYEVDGDAAAAQQTAAVMTRRFGLLGTAGVTARADGGLVIVEVPELSPENLERVRQVAARRGHLTFHAVDNDAGAMQAIAAQAGRDEGAAQAGIRVEHDAWQDEAGNRASDVYLVAADREEQLPIAEAKKLGCWRGEDPARCKVTGRQVIERYLAGLAAGDPSLAVAAERMIRFERLIGDEPSLPPRWRTYHLERADALEGSSIARARPGGGASDAEVVIELDPAGVRALAQLTRAQVGRKIAIVLDDRVMAAPVVMAPIASGRLSLPLGAERRADADELAIVLSGGALPTAVLWLSAEPIGAHEIERKRP